MGGRQTRKKVSRIDSYGSRAVSTFLYDQHRKRQLTEHAAIDLEITGCQGPGTGGVALRRVKPERDDQKNRIEVRYPLERDGQCFSVPVAIYLFRQGQVQVEASTFTFPMFITETGKVRVCKAGVSMDGHRQNVSSLVENILLPVSMMVIKIKNGYPPECTQILSSNSVVVEIVYRSIFDVRQSPSPF